jgi:hypothetical protein
MALKSISLATSEIAGAITDGDIGIETSVTITDNLYTADDLIDIIAETNKTITLKYTAAGTPISTSPEDLVTILAQVNKYTGPLTVTGIITTAEQLNYIAKKTTGKVTATLDVDTTISKATVDALKDVNSSDDITFVPTQDTVTGKAALEALVALNKKLPNTVWTTNVDDFEGTASEVAAIKAALKVVEDANVTITSGQISAADANALVVASEGIVTATIKDGSVAATLKALKDVADDAETNVLTFKSTDKTADAKALVDLADLVVEDFTSVQTITSKAADIGTNGDNVTDALLLVPAGAAVTITGAISAADAGAISAATAGKVTATITPASASDIVTGLDGDAAATDALNITVNGGTASVDNLKLIDAQTALKVKVDAAEVTATTYAQFEDIYVTGKAGFSNLGDENIVVGGTVNSAQADIVAKATSKEVTAVITGESAASVVTNLKNANAKDAFTIELTGAATAKDLLTLDGKTSVALNVDAVTTITGTAADVKKVYEAAGIATKGDEAITLTGTVKAADANYIALNTGGATGIVTATIAADTAAKLDAALTDITVNNYTLTVNGATASVAELNALAAKTAVAVDAIKVDAKEITGTGAELNTLYTTVGGKFANRGNENVKIDNGAAIGDINTVLDATTGVVTASATGLASVLAAGLTNATSGKDALTLKVNNEAGVTLTSAADLLKLDGFTSVKVDATGITNGITGTAADLKKLVAAKGVEVAKGVDITVAPATTASDLATILKSTLGTVTATVTADTAAKLNAALKDANSSDALNLTVNGTTASAKDLIALDGKTNVAITLDAGVITGNIAELTKVFVTDADNFTNEETTDATISGTITATQAETIADVTSGVVTATIAADTAAALNTALVETDVNAYKLTVNGTTADASDLNDLDDKTSITVNAAAIKNIEGDAVEVKAAYLANALKTISGLGNETVDLSTATDANAATVKAINDYTTGLITLPTITFGGETNFSLSQLGDLNGITKLANIEADNGENDTINISLKDLLAANDSKNNFTFNLDVNAGDVVNVTNDLSGWTQAVIDASEKYTYTSKTGQVVTIVADEAVITA